MILWLLNKKNMGTVIALSNISRCINLLQQSEKDNDEIYYAKDGNER